LFVVSSSKLPTYVLPLMPAMAALAAMAPPRRWLNMVSAALLLSLCGLTFYFRLRHGMPFSLTLPLDVATVCGAVAAMVAARANRIEAFRGVCVGTLLGVTVALLTLIPAMERSFRHNTSFKFFADRIRQEDPQREAFVVGYFCLPATLPFYLQEPVWFYNPDATNNTHVFEFHHPPPGAPFVISEWARYCEMIGSGRRVFCVTGNALAETMLAEPRETWHEVERAGKSVLLTNQP
jgi:4-amino-4-deoxy-L-arabinose transferase-like glycosyltransferase